MDAASLLAQFGAYGDPGRDPRMNVVTVGYLAVLRDVGASWPAPTRPRRCSCRCPTCSTAGWSWPSTTSDRGRRHRPGAGRPRGDGGGDRVRRAPRSPWPSCGPCTRRCGACRLDGANFRRGVGADDGWVIPTGRRARPGASRRQARRAVPGRAGMAARRAHPPPATPERPEATGSDVTAMRAVVHDRYGPPEVLRVDEVARPTPGDDEVLVRVHATTVNRTDCGFRDRRPCFVRLFSGLHAAPAPRPRHRVRRRGRAEVGADVTEFAVGDEVFGVNPRASAPMPSYLCVHEAAPIAAQAGRR